MTLMGGPIDPRVNPTAPNQLADLAPARLVRAHRHRHRAGALSRRVPPGLSRLPAACRLHDDESRPPHHRACRLFNHLVRGDGESAEATRTFYDEFMSVMDLPADFYLQTIKRVFQDHALPHGEFESRGVPVEPARDRAHRAPDRRGRERRHLRRRPDRRGARAPVRPRRRQEAAPRAAQGRPLRRLQRPPLAQRDLSQGARLHPPARLDRLFGEFAWRACLPFTFYRA